MKMSRFTENQIIGILRNTTLCCVITAMTGCGVRPGVYQSWGRHIYAAPKHHQTKEDISLMLGVGPKTCEKIPGKPTVGMLFRHDSGTTVLEVYPNSPAAVAGIKSGDKILAVNSKPVRSMEEIIASTEGMDSPHSSISIETQRGSYVVTPKYPARAEQCYWEIIGDSGEEISKSTSRGGFKYQRYFRATCRFADGKAYICHPEWRE